MNFNDGVKVSSVDKALLLHAVSRGMCYIQVKSVEDVLGIINAQVLAVGSYDCLINPTHWFNKINQCWVAVNFINVEK